MKTSTINYLILYGLEPSSDPKPENEPSKSAARPPSMSSDLMWFSQFDRAWDMSLLSAAVLHIKQEATSSKCFQQLAWSCWQINYYLAPFQRYYQLFSMHNCLLSCIILEIQQIIKNCKFFAPCAFGAPNKDYPTGTLDYYHHQDLWYEKTTLWRLLYYESRVVLCILWLTRMWAHANVMAALGI